jgi:molybdopterin-guanine dinucleotide biosynthesis protein A
VLTGLERLPEDADFGLFLAVDLPLVPISLLRSFVERAETGIDAVVAYSPSGPEPLCAIYGRACLEPVRRNLEAGQLKMTSFWTEISIHVLYEEAVADFGDPAQVFRNLNRPEDYEALRRLA